MTMKVRDVIRLLEEHGWQHKRTRGDHRQFTKPGMRAVVTVPGRLGDDLQPETLASVLRNSGLKGTV